MPESKGSQKPQGTKCSSSPKAKGKVCFLVERCKGCGFCIEFCPMKVLAFSKDYNQKGYHFPVPANADKCIGCNTCGLFCPDFAIWGERNKE